MERLNRFLIRYKWLEDVAAKHELRTELLEHIKVLVMVLNRQNRSTVSGKAAKEGNERVEDLSYLLQLFQCESLLEACASNGLLSQLMRALVLLTRHAGNRTQIDSPTLSFVLSLVSSSESALRRQAADLLRNLCHDKSQVQEVSRLGGIKPILGLLTTAGELVDTQSSACAVLQSISYRDQGRMSLLELGALPVAMRLMRTKYAGLRTHAIGLLRNLSVDLRVSRTIRDAHLIPILESMLLSRGAEEAGYAAGTIQNLARDEVSRLAFLEGKVVGLLGRLVLVCSYVPAQVAAVCALVNILSPTLGKGFEGFTRRRLMKAVLSDALAMSLIGSSLTRTSREWREIAIPEVKKTLTACFREEGKLQTLMRQKRRQLIEADEESERRKHQESQSVDNLSELKNEIKRENIKLQNMIPKMSSLESHSVDHWEDSVSCLPIQNKQEENYVDNSGTVSRSRIAPSLRSSDSLPPIHRTREVIHKDPAKISGQPRGNQSKLTLTSGTNWSDLDDSIFDPVECQRGRENTDSLLADTLLAMTDGIQGDADIPGTEGQIESENSMQMMRANENSDDFR
mmetsp:Transcript_14168/g.34530  ORF Transcript_14168/g.34530 Transcript_14168/m.34530 type:complete len:571 (-) Transcript_14168:326-2038(-)